MPVKNLSLVCKNGLDRLGQSPDGRRREAEESPGSTETRCRITSGGGDPRESATENNTAYDAKAGGKGETVR